MPAGIYVHIPFCLSKCSYCDFYSIVGDGKLIDNFTSALLAEIDLLVSSRWQNRVYNTVYFGGGTPSMLAPEKIGGILKRLRRTFNITPNAEISLEANPESVSLPALQALRDCGINRLSLGIQSLNDDSLRALGRIHNGETARRALSDALKAGFENVSADLIFAIPGQSVSGWKNDLEEIVDGGPAHISAYGLTIEKGTSLEKSISEGKVTPVDSDTQAEMYLALNEITSKRGYRRYEVSNFARPGFECRHNLKYWTDKKYLGLGPAAHSFDGSRRSANFKNVAKYITLVKSGKLPVGFKERLSDTQKAGERLMMGLRMVGGVSLDSVNQVLDAEALAELQQRGYIRNQGGNISLTDSGFLLADEVIVKLLRG